MKKIVFFLIFALMGIISWAQDADVAKRNVRLTIVDKKDRPIKNVKVGTYSDSQSGKTDISGQFEFRNMTDKDSIKVVLPTVGKTVISVDGLDIIDIKRLSTHSYSYMDKNAKNVMIEKVIKQSADIIDVPTVLAKRQVNSLIDLLKGNMPGLYIAPDNTATVRGVGGFNINNPEQTYEITVFVDGTQKGTLRDVNTFLNVRDIKTIELNKSGSGFGLQGAYGVLIITTINNSRE